MCNTVKPQMPAPPPPPPEPIQSTEITAQAKQAKAEQNTKSKQNLGRKSTILTGPQGVEDNARTAGKTLLGA